MTSTTKQQVHLTSETAPRFRANIRLLFRRLLFDDAVLGTNLEIGIYNYALKESTNRRVVKKWDNEHFVLIYLDRIQSIYHNLQQPSLRKQLQDAAVTVQEIAFMTHQEMNMDHWRDLIQEQMTKSQNTFETVTEASTDMFTCRRPSCRQNKCSYYQLQTRSADESITTYVTCCACGFRWRI